MHMNRPPSGKYVATWGFQWYRVLLVAVMHSYDSTAKFMKTKTFAKINGFQRFLSGDLL